MDTFTTHITFSSGDRHKETTRQDQLSSTLTRLVHGPAARLGLINEVKIVDSMDCIVFLARDNKVVFPPNPAEKNQK